MIVATAGVGKTAVGKIIEGLKDPDDIILVTDDMDAALKLQSGQIDYYIGTCHTGAGASLGVIPGLIGMNKCHTFGRRIPDESEVKEKLSEGKIAFGCCVDQADEVVPILWKIFKGE
ncbi:DUF2620 family protein [Boudabousia marimammalium]|uniref:DUF2620 domain-containing protein n=1 Tax=Boudabousia marimammalium TaxID=156892 RepID=A0A1Q5PSR2_9ACTO|nr:DUF2620 family protein [Boudabousia marimammalium]OKL50482.1 hypothetical protein BM477_00460 [Boudabousia marimammalium]